MDATIESRPSRPLERFCALFEVLEDDAASEHLDALRYAALYLSETDAEPARLAAQLLTLAGELAHRSGWVGALHTSMRFPIAAALLAAGDSDDGFHRELQRIRRQFPGKAMQKRTVEQALAVLILRRNTEDGRIAGRTLKHFGRIHEMMRVHHPMLTHRDDYPACALLCASPESVDALGVRVERFYRGLRELKFDDRSSLQTVSHLLYFNPAPIEDTLARFRRFHDAFRGEGLRMGCRDYDEIALLTYIDVPDAEIVAQVLGDRAAIRALSPRPSPEISFSLACGTAFRALAAPSELMRRIGEFQALLQVHTVLTNR